MMDSLSSHNANKIGRIINNFLTEEWLTRKNIEAKFDLPIVSATVPQQNNSCDCGVYTIHFAERFLKNINSLIITDKDLGNRLKNHAGNKWFPRNEISEKRVKMREIITDMRRTVINLNVPYDDDDEDEDVVSILVPKKRSRINLGFSEEKEKESKQMKPKLDPEEFYFSSGGAYKFYPSNVQKTNEDKLGDNSDNVRWDMNIHGKEDKKRRDTLRKHDEDRRLKQEKKKNRNKNTSSSSSISSNKANGITNYLNCGKKKKKGQETSTDNTTTDASNTTATAAANTTANATIITTTTTDATNITDLDSSDEENYHCDIESNENAKNPNDNYPSSTNNIENTSVDLHTIQLQIISNKAHNSTNTEVDPTPLETAKKLKVIEETKRSERIRFEAVDTESATTTEFPRENVAPVLSCEDADLVHKEISNKEKIAYVEEEDDDNNGMVLGLNNQEDKSMEETSDLPANNTITTTTTNPSSTTISNTKLSTSSISLVEEMKIANFGFNNDITISTSTITTAANIDIIKPFPDLNLGGNLITEKLNSGDGKDNEGIDRLNNMEVQDKSVMEGVVINTSKMSKRKRKESDDATDKNRINNKKQKQHFKCEFEGCTYTKFTLIRNFIRHGYTHDPERINKQCTVCDKRTRTKDELARHMRHHTGEKPYKCQWDKCTYAAKQPTVLKRHIRTNHTVEKPYKCQWDKCTYATKQPTTLKRHIRTHKKITKDDGI